NDIRAGQMVRLTDIAALVRAGTALEQFPAELIAAVGRQFYAAVRDYHGAVGQDWLEHLAHLDPEDIKQHLDRLSDAALVQPAVTEITALAYPQVVSVVNRLRWSLLR